MGKGSGGSAPTQQNVTSTTSNLPEYARPYFENIMNRAQAQSYQQYTPYEGQRMAGFTPAQEQIQQNVLGMTAPNQYGTGSALAYQAGLGALQQNYNPQQFSSQQVGPPTLSEFQMGPAMGVQAQQYGAPQMQAEQTGFQPNLQAFQFGPTQTVSSQMVGAPNMEAAQTGYGMEPLEQFRMEAPQMFGQSQATDYMSPYMRNVLDVQKREAVTDARKAQVAQDLGAARQGTYGGSRQLLASMERERNLGQQMGDIEARGLQAAFENAQGQFERDRAAGMQAGQANLQAALGQQQLGLQTGLQTAMANLSNEQQARVNNQATQFQAQGMNQEQAMRAALANQGVDVTRAQANQQAQLQTQQLGTQTGMQTSLANLDAASQARVQNLAAQLQTQGLNSEQAMRAALANQQAGLQVGQQNLQSLLQTQQLGADTGLRALLANQQSNLEAQRLGEQSRQFGASQGLQGLQAAGQMGQTLGNLGQYQQQSNLQRLQAQAAAASEQRGLQQQYLDQAYSDFLRQRDYPMETLGQFSNLLRGLPIGLNSTQTSYAPPPSMASQVLGTGLGALGMYNTLRG
jgi:hypothetical protein